MPGVLTKKQCWRRQSVHTRRSYLPGFHGVEGALGHHRSMSEGAIVGLNASPSLLGRKPFATTGDLQESTRITNEAPPAPCAGRRKSVMFSARVHVVLIPCVSEYEAAGLSAMMWWTDDDYKLFKQYALEEVKEFMLRCKIADSKEAIRQLYQHTPLAPLPQLSLTPASMPVEVESGSSRDSSGSVSTVYVGDEECGKGKQDCHPPSVGELEPSGESKSIDASDTSSSQGEPPPPNYAVLTLTTSCSPRMCMSSMEVKSFSSTAGIASSSMATITTTTTISAVTTDPVSPPSISPPSASFKNLPVFRKTPSIGGRAPLCNEVVVNHVNNTNVNNHFAEQVHPLALICS